jgi:hypothetical protein
MIFRVAFIICIPKKKIKPGEFIETKLVLNQASWFKKIAVFENSFISPGLYLFKVGLISEKSLKLVLIVTNPDLLQKSIAFDFEEKTIRIKLEGLSFQAWDLKVQNFIILEKIISKLNFSKIPWAWSVLLLVVIFILFRKIKEKRAYLKKEKIKRERKQYWKQRFLDVNTREQLEKIYFEKSEWTEYFSKTQESFCLMIEKNLYAPSWSLQYVNQVKDILNIMGREIDGI